MLENYEERARGGSDPRDDEEREREGRDKQKNLRAARAPVGAGGGAWGGRAEDSSPSCCCHHVVCATQTGGSVPGAGRTCLSLITVRMAPPHHAAMIPPTACPA